MLPSLNKHDKNKDQEKLAVLFTLPSTLHPPQVLLPGRKDERSLALRRVPKSKAAVSGARFQWPLTAQSARRWRRQRRTGTHGLHQPSRLRRLNPGY